MCARAVFFKNGLCKNHMQTFENMKIEVPACEKADNQTMENCFCSYAKYLAKHLAKYLAKDLAGPAKYLSSGI